MSEESKEIEMIIAVIAFLVAIGLYFSYIVISMLSGSMN